MTQARGGLAGLLSGAVAVVTAEVLAAWHPSGRSPVVIVGDAVIRLTPGPVVRFAIATFGDNNRAVLLASMLVVMSGVAFALGVAEARQRWSGVAGIVGLAAVGALAGVVDPLLPAVIGVGAPAVGAAAGAVTLRRLVEAAEIPADASAVTIARSRRAFLRGAMAAGAITGAGVLLRAAQWPTPEPEQPSDLPHLPEARHPVAAPPAAASLAVPGLAPLLTPNRDFYRIDTALTVPQIDPQSHRVRVTGMVDEPLEFTYADLLDLADTEAYVTLACVSNLVGGTLVGNARWQGVPLAELLRSAGVQPEATQIVGRAVDGWTSGFPVEAAFDGRPAMLAVGMNGEPLPVEHGFPARLVVPGLYGYVSATKWLAEIELTTFEEHDAYWVPRGWARRAPVKTQSRIDVPQMGGVVENGEVVVAGVAWSDERGISDVEVAVDSGAWEPAEVAAELATTSWRQWRFVWDATPGDHLVQVRAYDADGVPQTSETSDPAPDGATGWHRVRVTVL